MSAEKYQVGAHFKALVKVIPVTPSRVLDFFYFHFMSLCRAVPPSPWLHFVRAPPPLSRYDVAQARPVLVTFW